MKAGAGFTLIELLVTMTIVILLSGTALATFLNYQQRRQAQEDAANVADRLRTVQIKATAVEIPAGCSSVTNYTVTFEATGLAVAATCPGVGSVAVAGLALTLTNSVFQSSPFTITFDSRTVSASPRTINICGNSNLYQVTVNEAANVSRPVFVGGGC
ncbi:MAG TPA: prepilin-type N-terminal cleavage/methylation domain-containing protein [Patescibacteria group bacterium]|nr:prepilin-type N-terminal cleavage/methylation domain-containing protein [Patescibacteria group bacterium]